MLGDPCRPQAQGDRCDRRSVRPLHPAGHSRLYPVRQRTGVPRQGSTGMDRGCRCQDRLHRARQPLGERVHRELQRSPARRAARRRNLLHSPRGPNRHRELAAALQHDQAARIARIQAASSGGICPCLRRVAGCATPTGSAGHASATASLKLTFHLDHSVGANHCSMSTLAELPELIGFFSYSREDDEAFRGTLSALREGIQRELSAQLGRSKKNFRLWQDQAAIAPGKLWAKEIKTAIDQSVFFIPIVTPRAVNSKYCKFEFETFLAREAAIGRNDLVFPILYISVAVLESEASWRDDPVLSTIAQRQYVDWRPLRHLDAQTT